jgi:putative glycosyltransferase (TIGR04372 family)
LRGLRHLRSAPPKNANPLAKHSWHFEHAYFAYQKLDVDRALHHFQAAIEIKPQDWSARQIVALIHMQLLGDLQEALRIFRHARRWRERHLTPASGPLPYRFLDTFWACQIGHIANIEHLIKREILLGRDPKKLLLYLPENQKPANRALLNKLAAYITIIDEEAKLPYPRETMLSVMEEYFVCESIDGIVKHWWHASPEIFRSWEQGEHPPLLALTENEINEGRACLRQLGMPENAWFVCFHVRDNSFKRDQGFGSVESGLNAHVETYLPAMQRVVERGGWVVRIGDRAMPPIPRMQGTIDYARSSLKSDWMDVFLLGACRFFVGTSSGPAYVPPLFGKPCVLTNWWPTGQRPFNARDLYILKLLRKGASARPLSFAETVAPPIGYALGYVHAKSLQLTSVPNTGEEIREVVSEMLDRLDGTLSYTEKDEALQSAFDAVAETNLCFGNARVGRAFLQQHHQLLTDPGHHAP